MKKVIILFILILLTGINIRAVAQSYITIGSGTSSSELAPMNRSYNYSTHEAIYLQSELGSSTNFIRIAHDKASGSNIEGIQNVTIYMKHTSASGLSSGTYSLTGYTEVFNGTFTNNATSGWMEVTLDNSFSYNGTDNLQILLIKGYQSWTGNRPAWNYTYYSGTDRRARNAADNNSQPTSLTRTRDRPNLRLEYGEPLPVELISFTASVKDRDVKLRWVTAVELNNAGFEVKRKSFEVVTWTKIGFVQGNGTSNEPKNYSFLDKKLNTGKYNYRLKQIDYNNASTIFDLSNVIDIEVPKKYKLLQNYPNPFNPVTKIDYNIPHNSKVTLNIFDITGREIAILVNESQEAGYYTVQFNANKYASGTYFYRINAEGGQDNFVMTKRMILFK